MSDTPDTLAAALAVFQADLPVISKSETAEVQTKQGGTYTYTYAGLARIAAEVLPRLARLGLSFTTRPGFAGDRYVLIGTLMHTSGEREEGQYPLPTGGTPQALGSQITYGRRYMLCAMTGVAPEDDDDGAAAEAERAGQRGTAARSPQQQRQPQQRQTPPPAEGEQPTAQRSQPPLPGEDEPRRDGITEPQMKKIVAQMRELGITTKEAAMERVYEITGRRVESRSELTRAEAKSVIETLDGPPPVEEPPDGQ